MCPRWGAYSPSVLTNVNDSKADKLTAIPQQIFPASTAAVLRCPGSNLT